MVLFASRQTVLKGGEGGSKRDFTNKLHRDVDFTNTECSESPATCVLRTKKITRLYNTLLEEVMVLTKKTAKKNTLG